MIAEQMKFIGQRPATCPCMSSRVLSCSYLYLYDQNSSNLIALLIFSSLKYQIHTIESPSTLLFAKPLVGNFLSIILKLRSNRASLSPPHFTPGVVALEAQDCVRWDSSNNLHLLPCALTGSSSCLSLQHPQLQTPYLTCDTPHCSYSSCSPIRPP